MSTTPDRDPGTRREEDIIFDEQTSDPSVERNLSFVQNKGFIVFSDGSSRAVGEGRASHHQKPVDDRDVNDPPGSPTTGYRLIIGSAPTGAFSGHAREIAEYTGSIWVFTTPLKGMLVYVKDEDEPYKQVSSSSPWVWDRIYAKKHTNKNDSDGSALSDSWIAHLRIPASGTIDLDEGDYEIFANLIAWGSAPLTEIGVRIREDETTTIDETTVVNPVTGGGKQLVVLREWLSGLSGEHYYTVEFNKTDGQGTAYVSKSCISIQRLDNG